MKSCNECKYATMQDTGYSNYTVMGTDFECAKKLNPAGCVDAFWGQAGYAEFAEQCDGYVEGEPVCMDVDGEYYADFTDEEKAIWIMLCSTP